MTFLEFEEQYLKPQTDKQIKGTLFEILSKYFLTKLSNKSSKDFLSIDLWDDFKEKNGKDYGIDIVITTKDNEYIGVQCKYHKEPIELKGNLSNFFTLLQSGFISPNNKEIRFKEGILIAINGVTEPVQKQLNNIQKMNNIPIEVIDRDQIKKLDIDYKYLVEHNTIKENTKTLHAYQIEAINKVKEHYYTNNETRGKLIMACGTGKTYTSLQIIEQLTPSNSNILFLAPSIMLVGQTFREFRANRDKNTSCSYALICSDEDAGKTSKDKKDADEMFDGYILRRASTNPHDLIKAFKHKKPNERLIVFSTYQSIEVISKAQNLEPSLTFELMICDEAHKSVPSMDKKQAIDNVFAKCHDNDFLKANKRLYMTATPKVPKIKKNKDPQEIEFLSMDDETIFGKEIFYYGFGQAIAEKRLCDYKVLVLMTDTEEIADIVNEYNKKFNLKEEAHKKIQDKDEIDYEFVAKIIGMYKALGRHNIQVLDTTNNQNSELVDLGDIISSKQAISFSTFKSTSKKIADHASGLIEYYRQLYAPNLPPFSLEIDHIDGEMNATTRANKLEWLSHKADNESICKILSNARCLSEGVDVPSLDSVVFFDSKESKIDIAQSIGRAIRLDNTNKNKTHGYIILPVAYSNETNRSLNEYVKSTSFRVIWEVLGALRSVDDRFIADNIYIAPPMSERSSSGEKTKNKQTTISFEEGFRLAQKLQTVIAEKIGDSLYWENFGKKASTKIEPIKERLRDIDRKSPGIITDFLRVLRENIHHNIDKTQSLDMLASHLILNPIYKSILGSFDEPISKALDEQIAKLKKAGLNEGETQDLKDYYKEVERQAKSAKSDSSKLKLLNALHEAFIDGVYKKEKQKHGINLTPLEIIDFLLHSTNFLLQKHFNLSFEDKEVKILDPFTGTGAFISRLLSQENAFFQKENIFKKANDFYAQEIMLLSYHTAILKITQTLQEYDKNAPLFKNVILCDSLDYLEEQELERKAKFERHINFLEYPELQYSLNPLSENKKLKDKVAQSHITVICSNPPYSSKQGDVNENNANLKHPNLEKEVKKAYTGGFNKNEGQTTRDTLIQAIFMATQKIGERGIVSFVINNNFLDKASGAGFRKRLLEDFNEIYIVDLRGDLRSMRANFKQNEGDNIFGNIQVGVCLFLGVKNPSLNTHKLYYYNIGDNLKKKEKLNFLTKNKNLQNLEFKEITPNVQYDWLN
uniref:DEAD/DEAH box helicase family protein n=1 Tax=Helicobacter cetorum TaxID=138563 RepID=UPI000CF16DA8